MRSRRSTSQRRSHEAAAAGLQGLQRAAANHRHLRMDEPAVDRQRPRPARRSTLGGFSGLAFEGMTRDGKLKFITHTDRGPNGEPTGIMRPFLLPQLHAAHRALHARSGERPVRAHAADPAASAPTARRSRACRTPRSPPTPTSRTTTKCRSTCSARCCRSIRSAATSKASSSPTTAASGWPTSIARRSITSARRAG